MMQRVRNRSDIAVRINDAIGTEVNENKTMNTQESMHTALSINIYAESHRENIRQVSIDKVYEIDRCICILSQL